MFARIDRRRKLPVSIILRALGMNEAEILDTFFDTNTFYISKDEVALQLVASRLRGETATFEIRIGDQVIVEEGRRITARHVRQLEDAKVQRLHVPREYVYGKILAHDVVNTETGEIHRESQRRADGRFGREADRGGHHGSAARSTRTTSIVARTSPTLCVSTRPRLVSRRWSRSTA